MEYAQSTSIPDLVLRELTAGDSDAYFAMLDGSREHLGRYGDYAEEREADRASVDRELSQPVSALRMGIWHGADLVGRVDLIPREPGVFVLGYWLDGNATGKGYATVACRALIEHAKTALGATEVYAGVTHGNEPSIGVLRRLGFERVADMGSYLRFRRRL